jgi:hypothetical protein
MESLVEACWKQKMNHTKSELTTPFLGGDKAEGSGADGRRNKRLKLKRGLLRRIWYVYPLAISD